MKTEYPEIEQYMLDNPKTGPYNIARKFKLHPTIAKNIFDYIKLWIEPEDEVYHIKSITKVGQSPNQLVAMNRK
jgi:hypothetical protein